MTAATAVTTRIELTETSPSQQVRLTPRQVSLLQGAKELTVTSAGPGTWSVRSKGWKVGALRFDDVEVWIEPKLPIARLLFLLGYVRDPKGWKDDTVALDTADGLVPAVAQMLWRQVGQALARGPLQGYRAVEETSPVLRGRLRESDQMRRRHGVAIPVETSHDDFTVDTAENRILFAALTRMLTVPGVDDDSRRRLADLRSRLRDVTPLRVGAPLPAWTPTRLNGRYHDALRLAEVVLRDTSPEHAQGSVGASGFVFDMPKVFEDFVTVAVARRLGTVDRGSPSYQHPCYLDESSQVQMYPDLVWLRDTRPVAVVDAKYKLEKDNGGHPREDLYQVVAYCAALGLDRGHLVYASGSSVPTRYVVRAAGIELTCHALDLAQPRSALLAQVAAIGDDVLV